MLKGKNQCISCSLTCMTYTDFCLHYPMAGGSQQHSRRIYDPGGEVLHLYSTQKHEERVINVLGDVWPRTWFRFDSIYQSVLVVWRSLEPVRWSSTQTAVVHVKICCLETWLRTTMIVLALHPILRPKSFQRPKNSLSPQNTRCHWGRNPVITPHIVKVTLTLESQKQEAVLPP